MKKIFTLTMLAGTMLTNTFAQNGNADAITGTWLVQDGTAKVKIEKSFGKYVGKIVWITPPLDKNGKPWLDVKNPDVKSQSRPILGLPLLYAFVYDSGSLWTGGTIYDSDSGKTYSCKITLKDNQTMEVRGYVGLSLFGRTDTWKRVDDITMK